MVLGDEHKQLQLAGAQPVDGNASRSALMALLTRQRVAFANGPPSYGDRLTALRALERALRARSHDFAATISVDFGGRATAETRALEILPLLNEIRYARRHLNAWMASREAPVQWQAWPAKARVIYRPLGVVGIVSPWNYPLFLTIAPLIGALAAGNHVLIKPSELAPATAELIKSVLADLYAPEHVSVVTGGADTASALASLPLDHLLFTGSTRVGKLVMRAASENLVPVTLELGGKSPVLIHETHSMARAAKRIAAGKLYNAGQTCLAPDYVLAPRQRRDDFVTEVCNAITRMYPTLVDNPDYSRIISAQHHRRLTDLVENARRLGADVVEVNPGSEKCDDVNRVFPPTLITNIRAEMAIAREEIFGPVLPIVDYSDLDEAVDYVNARPHPLAFYYFDDKRRRATKVVERVNAGGATVNDCLFHVGLPGLPFGGVGPSGMGRYHGFDGFETFSHKEGILLQGRWSRLALLRPPYGSIKRSILKLLLRD